MDTIDWAHHNEYVWLTAGVALMALEAVGLPGTGVMFAGLGAVLVGAGLQMGWLAEGAYVNQFIWFFFATAIWSYALWKPLQKLHSGKRGGGYQNIVGDTAYVGSEGLHKDRDGEVTWSGTIMKARMAHGATVDKVDAGAPVEVVEVRGATLIVKPKVKA
jgi:membrane protein implicated in regulation of membrane protease activity